MTHKKYLVDFTEVLPPVRLENLMYHTTNNTQLKSHTYVKLSLINPTPELRFRRRLRLQDMYNLNSVKRQ